MCPTGVLGANGKVIIERLCISLPYVETFNSKVMKGFVLELRSRYVFFVFRDSYVLCIYVMNILCTFPIFMYGYVTQFFAFFYFHFVVCRNGKIYKMTSFLHLVSARSGPLGFGGPFVYAKSLRVLCVSISKTCSGLCVYHLE